MQEGLNISAHRPNQSDRVDAAWRQLELVLSFFSRVDTKLSVVLGINLGMLAVLAARVPKVGDITSMVILLTIGFVFPLVISFWHIWNGYFPDIRGGTNSLIYFMSISKMSESEFQRACTDRSAKNLEEDILGQCWRNSKILACKFHSLRCAYVATLFSIAFLVALVVVLSQP